MSTSRIGLAAQFHRSVDATRDSSYDWLYACAFIGVLTGS